MARYPSSTLRPTSTLYPTITGSGGGGGGGTTVFYPGSTYFPNSNLFPNTGYTTSAIAFANGTVTFAGTVGYKAVGASSGTIAVTGSGRANITAGAAGTITFAGSSVGFIGRIAGGTITLTGTVTGVSSSRTASGSITFTGNANGLKTYGAAGAITFNGTSTYNKVSDSANGFVGFTGSATSSTLTKPFVFPIWQPAYNPPVPVIKIADMASTFGRATASFTGDTGRSNPSTVIAGTVNFSSLFGEVTGVSGTRTKSVTVDLNGAYLLDRVLLYHYNDNRVYQNVAVDTSMDGVVWTTQFSSSYTETASGKVVKFPYLTAARYVRDSITHNTTNSIVWTNIQVYAAV